MAVKPREKRKKLINAIETKRNSKLITYATGDRIGLPVIISGDVVSLIHEHILSINPPDRNKLDLLIYSRGGDSDVPWALVSMIREYCSEGSFSVLIPYRAHSAATLIALGADEIVMTKKGELGPIDITIGSGPYNPKDGDTRQRLPVSVEDVTGYFGLMERIGCERQEEKLQGFQELVKQVHPLVIGTVHRLLEQTELVALRLLETRANPFTEEENRTIVKHLSSKIYSHSHAIHRTEALNRLGLKQIHKSEDANIDKEMWSLYCEYRDLLELEEPFLPEQHMIANDLQEHTWDNLGLACVESYNRCDICRKSTNVRRIRNMPPQVQIAVNVANIELPALPPGINPQEIGNIINQLMNQMIKPIIEDAANKAALDFLKALPTAGFERIDFNAGWKRED